jgi:hypothetical protein
MYLWVPTLRTRALRPSDAAPGAAADTTNAHPGRGPLPSNSLPIVTTCVAARTPGVAPRTWLGLAAAPASPACAGQMLERPLPSEAYSGAVCRQSFTVAQSTTRLGFVPATLPPRRPHTWVRARGAEIVDSIPLHPHATVEKAATAVALPHFGR